MRKLTEPQAHRGRVAVIEGRYPEGMQARCVWCREVKDVNEGELVTAMTKGVGATHLFRCGDCLEEREGAA